MTAAKDKRKERERKRKHIDGLRRSLARARYRQDYEDLTAEQQSIVEVYIGD